MKELTTWSELFFNSLQSFGRKIMETVPSILGAIIILLLGWLFARLVSKGLTKLLDLVKFDELGNKIHANEFLEKANVKLSPSQLVGQFIYWILILLVIVSAADALGWHSLSEEVSKLISYLPNLLVAIIFFIVGTFIATFLRDIIRGTSSSLGIGVGRFISSIVFYFLLILVSLTALEQAGVDTSIITSNLLLFLGAILGAGAISYGFASREVLANILASFFSRKTFLIGQTIEIEGERGQIIENSNISVTILNEKGEKIVIPAHQLITNRVKILE